LQVRNSATLGGNVAHALPAADGTIALLALNALAEIVSLEGQRIIDLRELFLGPGRTALDLGRDMLVGFRLPLRNTAEASAFKRVMRPQGVALPILNMAIWLKRCGELIADIRLALGPAGPVPMRALAAEKAMAGQLMIDNTLKLGLKALQSEATFRTSPYRSSANYRRRLSEILLEETLQEAWLRAT
jgi:carbon-monoxide dehydrogenase medium subunit